MKNEFQYNLGAVITNPKLRKGIYAGFVLFVLLLGAIAAGFFSAGVALPVWYTISAGVALFLSGPIGGLALANTDTNPVEVIADEDLVTPVTEENPTVNETGEILPPREINS